MAQLKTCTPALAKEVWQATPNPSTRRVATRLRQSGARISHGTVARWRSQGWRSLQQEPQHPLEIARDHLDDAVPVLSGDPMTTSTSFVRESAEGEALEHLSDTELQRRAARQVAVAVCVVSKIMLVKATLAVTKPARGHWLNVSRAQLRSSLGPRSRPAILVSGSHRRSLDYHPGATRGPSPAIDDRSPLYPSQPTLADILRRAPSVESRMGAVAWAMRQRSVSHPRSSNRTCRFPASGSRTRLHACAFACNAFCSF